jgi:class 3 adenylate cyclase
MRPVQPGGSAFTLFLTVQFLLIITSFMEINLASGAWIDKPDGTRHPLSGSTSMGRSSHNGLVVGSQNASRRHAVIHVQDEGEYWLIDLGSVNGTQINARRVSMPTKLKDGDRISIVGVEFVFHQTARPPADEEEAGLNSAGATLAQVRNEPRWLLLADIEGFTDLSQRVPPDDLATLVGSWVKAGREIVERHDGMVNKYLGDGYLACWAGASAQQVVAAVEEFRALQAAANPPFRIVLHHGTVSIGGGANHGEESLLGPEVNYLFRMEKAAGSAKVHAAFTGAAEEKLRGLLTLSPVDGQFELKGFAGTHRLHRL